MSRLRRELLKVSIADAGNWSASTGVPRGRLCTELLHEKFRENFRFYGVRTIHRPGGRWRDGNDLWAEPCYQVASRSFSSPSFSHYALPTLFLVNCSCFRQDRNAQRRTTTSTATNARLEQRQIRGARHEFNCLWAILSSPAQIPRARITASASRGRRRAERPPKQLEHWDRNAMSVSPCKWSVLFVSS